MAHSIELLLDERADTAVRELWQALAEAGLPSQQNVASATNRPHVTLIAAERIAEEVDAGLAELAGLFPLPATLGAPLLFGGTRLIMARLVVPSDALLALHRRVYETCGPFVSGLFPHSRPGHWTPHVTLGRRFTETQVGDAVGSVHGLAADIGASIVGLRRWDGDAKREYRIS
ncbi:2'-5' RNA ligase family protein [Mycobacterium sp. shizuoka-1]|uniref:2'-5' RNA ligase family protein n=1 Tax=Mycobacterium sp. shizuoka-1 TaxID=2039281 RepID=UPI000C06076F|nr:2'-5' RNA ligase family protein [Mycobacterium sp. shizuoka-1]GAY18429.1 hypothetical protein MSZK_51550 [Mycobacterium sp. shizuoka-1]